MSYLLDKELKEVSKRDRVQSSLSSETEKLLIGFTDEQASILARAGLSSNPIEKKENNQQKRIRVHEQIYNKPAYSGAQLKEMCNKYDLKLLSTKDYFGVVPPNVADSIKSFCDSNNLVITPDEMFILAPREMFRKETDLCAEKDPILFYRTHKGDHSFYARAGERDTFSQICNWGSDFSLLRRFWWLWEKEGQIQVSSEATYLSNWSKVKLALTSLVFNLFLFGMFYNTENTGALIIFTSILTFISSLYILALNFNSLKITKEWNLQE